jgi:hypothetical protein
MQLARAVEQLPGPHGMPGGSRYELKWDGFRVAVVCRHAKVRLWSRNGKDFTAKFPDVQAALEAQLSADCVLDGELVVWTGDDSTSTLCSNGWSTPPLPCGGASRLPNPHRSLHSMAWPSAASTYVRCDGRPAAGGWNRAEASASPLQLSPVTDDPDEARSGWRPSRPPVWRAWS